MGKAMKILVIGCGSIGCRHLRLLEEMGVEVCGYDVDPTAIPPGVLFHLGSLSGTLYGFRPDGVIIATPNHLHIPPALQCLGHEIPLLIEKPLAHTVEEAARFLVANAGGYDGDEPKVPVLVGYNLRHNPALRHVKEQADAGVCGRVLHVSAWCSSHLPSWRPGVDYRQNYAARPETGGGVLLDASHEIDTCLWLLGKPVSVMAQVRNTGTLEIATEDIADLLVTFESSATANIHLDYLGQPPRRGCLVLGDKSSLAWDIADSPDRNEMYRLQLQHFVNVIEGREAPVCSSADGLTALKVVEAARKSVETGKVVYL